MATARRRDEWDRTAALMSWVSCIWSKKARFEPDRLNPVRQAEAKAGLVGLTPEQMKARRREQVRTLGRMLAEAKKKRQPKPGESWPVTDEQKAAARKTLRPDESKGG